MIQTTAATGTAGDSFEELRYQKCTVEVHGDNEAPRRLHERMGFEPEGVHRRMIYTRGSYVDVYWYVITAEEFATRFGPLWR